MATSFVAPGPGRWELDRSHFPGGATPIAQELMATTMEAGMRRVMADVGVPADSVQARFVNGFMYTRLRPLIGADKPPRKLPPAFVLKLATRLHPEFRARTRTATMVERDRPSVAVAEEWARTTRPRLVEQNRSLQRVDVHSLDDEELAAHVRALIGHLRTTGELHFWLHGHDLGPIARYLNAAIGWGLAPADALAALAGASPSTSAPARTLVRLRALVDAAPGRPATLDDVRAVSAEAAELLDEYLAERGQLLVTGYDLTSLTLAELPGAVLQSILGATEPKVPDADAAAASLRARVPAADGASFDAELADARAVMDMRDDNGPITYEWPAGLLRRALLEVGRRLVVAGRLAEIDHALELTVSEAGDPFSPSLPTAATIAARAAERMRLAQLDPPKSLGPEEPQPPLTVLPPALARGVGAVQTAMAQLDMGGLVEKVDPLAGVGIGQEGYRGRVCRADNAEEAMDLLEPGDVLVVRATSPAFNVVLAIAGAVVTTDGGPMSHAAVLARELGIPAIIGARGALSLAHGTEVEVDPVAGVVRPLAIP